MWHLSTVYVLTAASAYQRKNKNKPCHEFEGTACQIQRQDCVEAEADADGKMNLNSVEKNA